MAVAGDIKIVMTLDDKDFTVKVQNSGKIIRELTETIKESANSTKALENHFTSLSSTFTGTIHTLGMLRFAIYDLRDLFGATIEPIIKASAEIERMTKLMEGLSAATTQQGKAQEAIANRSFVFDFAKNAPYDVKTLTDSFVKFKSAGLDPADGSMKSLVDSVAKFGGSSDLMHRASIAIQQMAGKGVISMEELRQQLGEAIPTAMKSMATSAGMSLQDFTKLVSKGVVESKAALSNMFYQMKIESEGSADAMMQTWTGQFEKLKTQYTLFANDVGTHSGLFDALKDELKQLNQWFNTDAAQKFAVDLGNAFSNVVTAIGDATRFIYDHIDAIKKVGEVMAVVWGVQKILAIKDGIVSMVTAATEKLTAMAVAQNSQLALQNEIALAQAAASKKAIMDEAVANNQRIIQDAAAAKERIAILEVQLAEQQLLEETYRKEQMIRFNIAQQAMAGIRKGYNAKEIADLQEMQAAYGAYAVASEAAAAKISAAIAAEAQVVAGASTAMRANYAATAEAVAATAAATEAATVTMGTTMLALSELAGPIMWIATILGAGVLAWQAWGDSAEESLDKAIKKTKEFATEENLAELARMNREQAKRRAQLQKDLASGNTQEVTVNGPGDITVTDNRKAMEAELAQLTKEQNASYAAWAEGRTKLTTRKMAQEASEYQQEWTNKITLMSEETNKTIRQQVANLEEQYGSSTDAKTKIAKETVALEKKNRKDLVDQEISILKTEETRLLNEIKNSSGAQHDALLAKLKANTDLQKTAQAEYAQIERLGSIDTGGGKVGKSGYGALTPMEQYLAKLKEQRADLTAQTEGFLDGIAKFNQMLADGRFTKTVTDPVTKKQTVVQATIDEIRQARELLSENESLKEKLKDQENIQKEFNSSMSAIANEALKISEKNQTAWENFNSKTKLPGNKELTNFNAMAEKDLAALKAELEMKSAQAREDYNKHATYAAAQQILSEEQINAALASRKALLDDLRAKLIENQALDTAASMRTKADSIEAGIADNKVEQLKQQAANEIAIETAKYDKLTQNAELSAQARLDLETQFNREVLAINNKLARDIETPTQKLARQWKDTTTAMQEATANWANSAADAFVEFAKTGKFNFKSLVDSILTDILRIQTRKEMTNFFLPLLDKASSKLGDMMSGVFNFANGGIMTGSGAVELRKYASGGVANAPQLALYGEGSMNEAYVPLPDGRTIPVTLNGSNIGGNSSGNVTVNVINQTSTQVTATKSEPRFDGRQLILDVVLTAANQPGQFRDGMKGALA